MKNIVPNLNLHRPMLWRLGDHRPIKMLLAHLLTLVWRKIEGDRFRVYLTFLLVEKVMIGCRTLLGAVCPSGI